MLRDFQPRRTEAAREQAILGDPEIHDQEIAYRLRATLGECEVVVWRARGIGVASDKKHLAAKALVSQRAAENGEGREGAVGELRRVDEEQHFDIDVRQRIHALDLGCGHRKRHWLTRPCGCRRTSDRLGRRTT